MARPSKLTPDIQAAICRVLSAGTTRAAACAAANVTFESFRKWCKNRPEFLAAVRKAELEAVTRNVAVIQRAAQGGGVTERTTKTDRQGRVVVTEKHARPEWTAAAWWLERKFPAEFGSDRTLLALYRKEAAERDKRIAELEKRLAETEDGPRAGERPDPARSEGGRPVGETPTGEADPAQI